VGNTKVLIQAGYRALNLPASAVGAEIEPTAVAVDKPQEIPGRWPAPCLDKDVLIVVEGHLPAAQAGVGNAFQNQP
jgi:hypothetical protein